MHFVRAARVTGGLLHPQYLYWMRLLAFASIAAFFAATAGGQEPRPSVSIPRIDAQIVVDGVLDEPAWEKAALLDGFHQYQPVDGRPARERTEVRVWYAPDALMVGTLASLCFVGVVVAQYAEVLRQSPWGQETSLRDLAGYAERLVPLLPNDPDVAEFAQLVARAATIRGW